MDPALESFIDPRRYYCGILVLKPGDRCFWLFGCIWRLPRITDEIYRFWPAVFDVEMRSENPGLLPFDVAWSWPKVRVALSKKLLASGLPLGTPDEATRELDRILGLIEPHVRILAEESTRDCLIEFDDLCRGCQGLGCGSCYDTGAQRSR